jgi:hypothetical protein
MGHHVFGELCQFVVVELAVLVVVERHGSRNKPLGRGPLARAARFRPPLAALARWRAFPVATVVFTRRPWWRWWLRRPIAEVAVGPGRWWCIGAAEGLWWFGRGDGDEGRGEARSHDGKQEGGTWWPE